MQGPARYIESVVMLAAVHRLTTIAVDEEITSDARSWLFRRYPPETTKLGYLASCRRCSSVHAGAAVLLLWRIPLLGRFLVYTLALSNGVLALDFLHEKLKADGTETEVLFN